MALLRRCIFCTFDQDHDGAALWTNLGLQRGNLPLNVLLALLLFLQHLPQVLLLLLHLLQAGGEGEFLSSFLLEKLLEFRKLKTTSSEN